MASMGPLSQTQLGRGTSDLQRAVALEMKGAARQNRRMYNNHMFLEGKAGSGRAPARVQQAAVSCSKNAATTFSRRG